VQQCLKVLDDFSQNSKRLTSAIGEKTWKTNEVACKRDVRARNRDVRLSVRDETETERSPQFPDTETSRPRLHP